MSIDIVNLIESNPITKLNGNYQSKLVEKVQNKFNNYEQQMFLASFYCYLKHDNKNDFVIDLDNVWNWLGFNQKYNAKCALEKNFTINKDYKIIAHEPSGAKNKTKGGHNKEIIMLNIETFKRFCLKAGTKKADEIHDYYIKLENVLQEILIEEGNELKLQLEDAKNEIIQIEETHKTELDTKVQREREQILLREFKTICGMVYIIKVKTHPDGTYVVKIGESRIGIQERYNDCKLKHGNVLLLDCFAVNKSKDFETFIHKHEYVRINQVNDLPGHDDERELFLIGKNLSYKTLLNVINNNLKYFNSNDTNKLELEIEKLKLMLEMKGTNNDNLLIQELVQSVKQLSGQINNLEKTNQEMMAKLNSAQMKTTTGFNEPLVTLGPRLQKINPETMIIIKVYESVAECLKEHNFKIKRPSIDKAVTENTVYNGFRWAFVDRNLDPNVLYNILPTKQTKIQNLGYIAKLNTEKTEILNVYLDRKTAASLNGYASSSALDTPVKNASLTNGHYYLLYDKCPQELIDTFEKKYGEPILYKDGIGQYTDDNKLIKEFICKYDCIKQLKMSDKTLTKALDNNILYNNFFFCRIGSKMKWI
jgi:phage anti-repressor protein